MAKNIKFKGDTLASALLANNVKLIGSLLNIIDLGELFLIVLRKQMVSLS